MNTIVDKVNALDQTKQAIKQSLINRGIAVADSDTFRSYADKLNNIPSGNINFGTVSGKKRGGGNPRGICSFLNKINLNTFASFPGPVDISYMIAQCPMLEEITLTVPLKVSNAFEAFAIGLVRDVTTPPLTLDLRLLDTSQCTDMYGMFEENNLLKEVDISGIHLADRISSLFYQDEYLQTVKMEGCDAINRNWKNVFDYCRSLKNITWPNNVNCGPITLTHCPITKVTCLDLFNKLITPKENTTEDPNDPRIWLSANTMALLSEDDKLIATNKGWILEQG